MDLKARQRAAQNAIYILSGLIIMAVIIMTLVTSIMKISNREEDDTPLTDDANAAEDLTAQDYAYQTEPYAKAPPPETEAVTEASAVVEETVEAAETNDESAEVAAVYNTPVFVMPVSGVLTRDYDDTIPVWSQTMDDYRVHTAIDISMPYGSGVMACGDGEITAVYDDPFYGVTIAIDHGDGLISMCGGLSQTTLEYAKVGTVVKAGDMIGAVGESAGVEMADEPHIHLSMSLNGEPVNPLSYIPYDEAAAVIAYEDE